MLAQKSGDIGERTESEDGDLAGVGLELGVQELDGGFLDGTFTKGGTKGVLHLSLEVRPGVRLAAR